MSNTQPQNMKKVHSYGAGVQSVALLHMYLAGELPRPDLVVFADTQSEPRHVYEVLERDKTLCERAGIPFYIVTGGNLAEAINKWGGVYIPAHTTSASKRGGMLRRQCTEKYKVTPIKRFLRAMGCVPCELWLGITTDEIARAKTSPVKWITHRFPLLENNLSRNDCLLWLEKNNITAAKSACVFCPYQSNQEWVRVRQNPDDWALACRVDEKIRHARPGQHGMELYVHPSKVPLSQVALENPDIQPGLWDNECSGGCGL